MKNKTPKRIVITGGPGTGKTSLVTALEESGRPCFHELIRSMTLAAKTNGNGKEMAINPLTFVEDPLSFNQQLLKGRLQQFKEADKVAGPMVFYDRGLPDVLAYMDYFGQPYGAEFEGPCLTHRYDLVLLLPPWEAIYIQDNERLENFGEAVAIHDALEHAYKKLGYHPIEVPIGKVEDRLLFVTQLLD
jgi:predicted ATPase